LTGKNNIRYDPRKARDAAQRHGLKYIFLIFLRDENGVINENKEASALGMGDISSIQGSGPIHLAEYQILSDPISYVIIVEYKYICIAMKDCIAKEAFRCVLHLSSAIQADSLPGVCSSEISSMR
jgi:hypothetical protein